MPVPRGPKSHLWQPETRKSQPRSGSALRLDAEAVHGVDAEKRLRLAELRVALDERVRDRAHRQLDPVLECTQVSATAASWA